MKRIIPDVSLKNCKEALEFYKVVFGGEIKNVQMADGKEMFKGYEGKVIHSELVVNEDCILYLHDILDDKKEEANNISLLLELESQEEINRLYSEISSKGTVHYELQKTFWGSYHAVVTDCFGTTWEMDFSGR